MKNIEQELKIILTEREYSLLAQRADASAQLQTNWYFGYVSMPRDMMVRLRKKGEEFVLCCKRRLNEQDGVTVSDEREQQITVEHAEYILTRGVTADEMRKLLGVYVPSPLKLVGKLDTFRTKFVLNGWVLELDKNVYLDITDYELECENSDVLELNRLKNYLYHTFGILSQPSRPKSERFWEALKR